MNTLLGQCVNLRGTDLIHLLGHYDFCDAENMDGIMESTHKNRIYCIKQNVMEFAKFLDELIKSRSVHFNQNAIWTSVCEY